MGNFLVPAGLLTFCWICAFLALGFVLRTKVKLFQKGLLPSCMIGGVLGLVISNTGLVNIDSAALGAMTYHFFALSFMSLALAGREKSDEGGGSRVTFRATLHFALLFLAAMFGQAFVGGCITYVMAGAGMDVFPEFGTMVASGFAQGPGQAITMGKIWEASGRGGGVELSQSIGLIFASLGFVMAFGVGVPLMNWGIKRGLAQHLGSGVTKEVEEGIMEEDSTLSMGRHTTHASNIDTLAVHVMLLGICYLLTYAFCDLGGMVIARLPIADPQKWVGFSWGMFFLYGLFMASAMRLCIDKAGYGHLISTPLQNRITGMSVDFLIVCTLVGVKMAVVSRYIVPISVIAIVVTLLSLGLVYYYCRRFDRDQLEQMGAIFGTVTGTASTGVLLIRLVDPGFKTPAAYATAAQNLICLPLAIFAMILYAAPFTSGMSMPMALALHGAFTVGCVVALHLCRLVQKPAW